MCAREIRGTLDTLLSSNDAAFSRSVAVFCASSSSSGCSFCDVLAEFCKDSTMALRSVYVYGSSFGYRFGCRFGVE